MRFMEINGEKVAKIYSYQRSFSKNNVRNMSNHLNLGTEDMDDGTSPWHGPPSISVDKKIEIFR